ncbi:MAG: TIGR02172 family protein [Prevotella sp.]|nr:TIGR02172 family protein [Prevotella sp.]MBR1499517.1 TIGR02172 family protein [Bacteroidaceae bacterium]
MNTYKTIDLNDYTQIGEGGNGKTYVTSADSDEILKVNNARLSTLEAVKHEYDVSKAVASLEISVPAMYRIVQVGDAYATISQRIKDKKSLSRICHDEPERTEEMARLLCCKGKELFATPCNTEFFPSRKAQALQAIEMATFVSRKNRERLRTFVESIPENSHCVHGDFQPGNIIQTGADYYWIDLDRFAYGDPMFDIGHLFLICHIYAPMKRVQDIFHMTLEQFHRFWDAFAKEYTGQDDHAAFDAQAGRFAALDVILRIVFQKPNFVEKLFFSFYVRKLMKQYYS